jgi:hypothetical protein
MTTPAVRRRSGRRQFLLQLAMGLSLAPLPWQQAWSLSCVGPGPLLPLPPSQSVVLGEILVRQEDGSVVIRVVEVLQGSLPSASTSPAGRLRLDSRSLSYWSFGRLPFPKGSRWIFALGQPDRQGSGFDYTLSPCSEPPQVVQGVVRGMLFNSPGPSGPQSMTVEQLRTRIRAEARSPAPLASPRPPEPPGSSR